MSDGGDLRPLIVTCRLDEASFQRFDALRREHFPRALNKLSAHLTLFHHLPGDRIDAVRAALSQAARRAPPVIEVTGLRKLGRGVAYAMRSPELDAARAVIATAFADSLTPQDRQGFRPHVTVQNKVDPGVAAALFDQLTAAFTPFAVTGGALQLWHYAGGPWEAAGEVAFTPLTQGARCSVAGPRGVPPSADP